MAVRVLHLGAFIDEGYFTIHNVRVITPLLQPFAFYSVTHTKGMHNIVSVNVDVVVYIIIVLL